MITGRRFGFSGLALSAVTAVVGEVGESARSTIVWAQLVASKKDTRHPPEDLNAHGEQVVLVLHALDRSIEALERTRDDADAVTCRPTVHLTSIAVGSQGRRFYS